MRRFFRPSLLVPLAIALLVLALPGYVVYARVTDDRPRLQDVQAEILPLFVETARLINPTFEVRPFTHGNAGTPFDLPNDPFGYDHCDAWRDWILPGWIAFLGTSSAWSPKKTSERS